MVLQKWRQVKLALLQFPHTISYSLSGGGFRAVLVPGPQHGGAGAAHPRHRVLLPHGQHGHQHCGHGGRQHQGPQQYQLPHRLFHTGQFQI